MQISGQCAIVTGGASGLGAEVCRELASQGARVTVLDVNLELALGVAKEINAHAARCDVTSSADIEAALEHAF